VPKKAFGNWCHSVLVVSDIDLTTNLPVMKSLAFLKSSIKDFILNINNDYRYMKIGYYVSLHAEILENPVIPSSENIIDANRIPILLLRAQKAGISSSPYLVTNSVKQIITEIGFPVIVFAVNPFSHNGFRIAKNRSALYRAVKSLSMNYKYTVCVQPLIGEVISFKSIFGKCELDGEIGKISEKVYEVFEIPICKVNVQRIEGKPCLCGLQSLKMGEILPTDLKVLSEEIISKKADAIG